jgi:hypothetical protein
VWIVEVGSSVDAPTLLLEAVFLTPAAWRQRKRRERSEIDKSEEQISDLKKKFKTNQQIKEVQNSSEELPQGTTSGVEDAVLSNCNVLPGVSSLANKSSNQS